MADSVAISESIPGTDSAGILRRDQLADPKKFVKIAAVPLFDAHRHRRKGDVDEHMLSLIAENTNERADKGNFPLVLLGHTFDEHGHEDEQPPTVGFALNFKLDKWNGNPCLFGDLYVRAQDYDKAMTYPHRSIERVTSDKDPEWNYLENVSLLRRAPDRHLGLLVKHEQELPSGVTRERYCMDVIDPVEEKAKKKLERLVQRYQASHSRRLSSIPSGSAKDAPRPKLEGDQALAARIGRKTPTRVALPDLALVKKKALPPCPKCGGACKALDDVKCVCEKCGKKFKRKQKYFAAMPNAGSTSPIPSRPVASTPAPIPQTSSAFSGGGGGTSLDSMIGSTITNADRMHYASSLMQEAPGKNYLGQDRLFRGLSRLAAAKHLGIKTGRRYKGPNVNIRAIRAMTKSKRVMKGVHHLTKKYHSDRQIERYLLGSLVAKPISAAIGSRMGAKAPQMMHSAAGMMKQKISPQSPQATQMPNQLKPEPSAANIPHWLGEGSKRGFQWMKEGANQVVAPGGNLKSRVKGAVQAGFGGAAGLATGAMKEVAEVPFEAAKGFAEGWASQDPKKEMHWKDYPALKKQRESFDQAVENDFGWSKDPSGKKVRDPQRAQQAKELIGKQVDEILSGSLDASKADPLAMQFAESIKADPNHVGFGVFANRPTGRKATRPYSDIERLFNNEPQHVPPQSPQTTPTPGSTSTPAPGSTTPSQAASGSQPQQPANWWDNQDSNVQKVADHFTDLKDRDIISQILEGKNPKGQTDKHKEAAWVVSHVMKANQPPPAPQPAPQSPAATTPTPSPEPQVPPASPLPVPPEQVTNEPKSVSQDQGSGEQKPQVEPPQSPESPSSVPAPQQAEPTQPQAAVPQAAATPASLKKIDWNKVGVKAKEWLEKGAPANQVIAEIAKRTGTSPARASAIVKSLLQSQNAQKQPAPDGGKAVPENVENLIQQEAQTAKTTGGPSPEDIKAAEEEMAAVKAVPASHVGPTPSSAQAPPIQQPRPIPASPGQQTNEPRKVQPQTQESKALPTASLTASDLQSQEKKGEPAPIPKPLPTAESVSSNEPVSPPPSSPPPPETPPEAPPQATPSPTPPPKPTPMAGAATIHNPASENAPVTPTRPASTGNRFQSKPDEQGKVERIVDTGDTRATVKMSPEQAARFDNRDPETIQKVNEHVNKEVQANPRAANWMLGDGVEGMAKTSKYPEGKGYFLRGDDGSQHAIRFPDTIHARLYQYAELRNAVDSPEYNEGERPLYERALKEAEKEFANHQIPDRDRLLRIAQAYKNRVDREVEESGRVGTAKDPIDAPQSSILGKKGPWPATMPKEAVGPRPDPRVYSGPNRNVVTQAIAGAMGKPVDEAMRVSEAAVAAAAPDPSRIQSATAGLSGKDDRFVSYGVSTDDLLSPETAESVLHDSLRQTLGAYADQVVDPQTGKVDAQNIDTRNLTGYWKQMADRSDHKPGTITPRRVNDIKAIPELFQYKGNFNPSTGETGSIGRNAPYDPKQAGHITIWKATHDIPDPKDPSRILVRKGEDCVQNGYNRHAHAVSNGEEYENVIYSDAKNFQEARLQGALQNMGEGHGTPVDAAKILRMLGSNGDYDKIKEFLKGYGLDFDTPLMGQASALASLPDEIYNKIIEEDAWPENQRSLPTDLAVVIGNAKISDDDKIRLARRIFDSSEQPSKQRVATFAARMERSGTSSKAGKFSEYGNKNLFGDDESENNAWEGTLVEDALKKEVNSRLFKTISNKKNVKFAGNRYVDLAGINKNAVAASRLSDAYKTAFKLMNPNGRFDDIYDAAGKALNGTTSRDARQEIIQNAVNQALQRMQEKIDPDVISGVSGSQTTQPIE